MNQTKLNEAHDRLIACSYALAGILGAMLSNGDCPTFYEEQARLWLKHHKAAAARRKEALNAKP